MAGDDVVNQILYASSHDVMLCFSNGVGCTGESIPASGRIPYARGKAIINLLRLDEGEKIRKILPVQELSAEGFVVMVSKKARSKRPQSRNSQGQDFRAHRSHYRPG